ncbi:hypothetical protein A8B78_04210 [Jannaschia sp. EhC01]|nr:hypothetical protein A8B78_04210 [Jannaschia sp. EhC01]
MIMEHTQQQLRSDLEDLILEATLAAMVDDTEAPRRMAATQALPQDKADRAQAALQKLARNQKITAEDQFLIEAIIIPNKRLVIDIVNGGFWVLHPLWVKYNVDKTVEQNIERAIRGVAGSRCSCKHRSPLRARAFWWAAI